MEDVEDLEYEADERAEAEARENAALDAFIDQLHADIRGRPKSWQHGT